jgi:hypothetical protein
MNRLAETQMLSGNGVWFLANPSSKSASPGVGSKAHSNLISPQNAPFVFPFSVMAEYIPHQPLGASLAMPKEISGELRMREFRDALP